MIVAVSGLSRSGTSMMMRMLAAGGLHALWDDLGGNASADSDNPNGYYEFSPVHALDFAFLADPVNAGCCVKLNDKILRVDSAMGRGLAVIVMRRPTDQIVTSFNIMRANRGMDPVDPVGYGAFLDAEIVNVETWCAAWASSWMRVDYPTLVTDPVPQAALIADFVAQAGLPRPDAAAMATIPTLDLWRQRSAE